MKRLQSNIRNALRNYREKFMKNPMWHMINWLFWITNLIVLNVIICNQIWNVFYELIYPIVITIAWVVIIFVRYVLANVFLKGNKSLPQILQDAVFKTALFTVFISVFLVVVFILNGIINVQGDTITVKKFVPGEERIEEREVPVKVYREVETELPLLPVDFSDDSTIVIDTGIYSFPHEWYETNTGFFSTYTVVVNRNNTLKNLATKINEVEFGKEINTIEPVLEADFKGDVVYIGYPGEDVSTQNKHHDSTLVIVSPKEVSTQCIDKLKACFLDVKVVSFTKYK